MTYNMVCFCCNIWFFYPSGLRGAPGYSLEQAHHLPIEMDPLIGQYFNVPSADLLMSQWHSQHGRRCLIMTHNYMLCLLLSFTSISWKWKLRGSLWESIDISHDGLHRWPQSRKPIKAKSRRLQPHNSLINLQLLYLTLQPITRAWTSVRSPTWSTRASRSTRTALWSQLTIATSWSVDSGTRVSAFTPLKLVRCFIDTECYCDMNHLQLWAGCLVGLYR